jgi:hypothetical protein
MVAVQKGRVARIAGPRAGSESRKPCNSSDTLRVIRAPALPSVLLFWLRPATPSAVFAKGDHQAWPMP